ncbi:hypothetical protein AB205_0093940 [Aquarana catesbeiana]|uniref:Uncharacterized protein n=2 Tax=Aquarana catesbeiana TaxID=8400 RepID=A0A2G9QA00_AQUCT|nr:hypothetical protein AB205_0093940 [Aquarana catesbeiana]
MAETEQVSDNYTNEEEEEESPEPETSRSRRRRFKASNMSFVEMVEMVDILKKADYDGKYGPYPNPNVRKAKIMAKVVKSLHRNFGVRRSKDQIWKRWSDLKIREHEQYRRIRTVLQKNGLGRKDSEDTPHPRRRQTPHLRNKWSPTKDNMRRRRKEEGDVVEIVTTTVDRDVVDPGHFTSESAQILIGEIMGCNGDLENIQKNINDVKKKIKNIIDVLGRV